MKFFYINAILRFCLELGTLIVIAFIGFTKYFVPNYFRNYLVLSGCTTFCQKGWDNISNNNRIDCFWNLLVTFICEWLK